MSAHTPGPWEAVDRFTVRSAYSMGDKSKPGWIVATLSEAALPSDSALIAAAPELLAALKDVIGWVAGPSSFHTDAPLKAVDRARAAIAKAEGRA
ncbi:hypothetical protein [Ralstonia sp.]|uniref:hypothetical protein n=1 Tax=Ralstonia sp. TaxID=54061 RepID=UPI00257E8C3E|nr:hypothetical protein [Ralstonia sp.]MBA4282219.1 hypothetical protein [Ralstonia sp.]